MQWVATFGSKTSLLIGLLEKQRSVKVHKNSHNTPSKTVHFLQLACVGKKWLLAARGGGLKRCVPESQQSRLMPATHRPLSLPCFLSLCVHPGQDRGVTALAQMCRLFLLAPILRSLLPLCFVLGLHLLTGHVSTEAGLDLGSCPVCLRVV